MAAFWVQLANQPSFCLIVEYDQIKKLMKANTAKHPATKVDTLDYPAYQAALDAYLHKAASQYGEVVSVKPLPYAASPMKHAKKGTPCDEWTLCWDPENCCGKNSCPKNRACSE